MRQLRRFLVFIAYVVCGALLGAFLGLAVPLIVSNLLWPPERPPRGMPPLWPYATAILGLVIGFAGGLVAWDRFVWRREQMAQKARKSGDS